MNEEQVNEEEVVEVTTPEAEVEVEVDVEANEEEAPSQTAKKGGAKSGSATLKDAWRQVENFGQTLSEALQGRGNVVMVRVNDEALDHLDMLVEGEITKSRSESAAFLINEGINANEALFTRIKAITEQIADLREKLRKEVNLVEEEE